MLRALLTNENGMVTLVLGFGRQNFERLHNDQPVELDLHDVSGMGDMDLAGKIDELVIFDASTPEKLERFLALTRALPHAPPPK